MSEEDNRYTSQIHDYDEGNGDNDGNNNGLYPQFVYPVSGEVRNQFTFVHQCKIRFLMTEDLAYYATCVGKIDMSGMRERMIAGHDKGDRRSLKRISEIREKINGG